LGQSLGIDAIPLKTCNWNCVYCQLGRTRPLENVRRDYYPGEDILHEVERAIRAHPSGGIDWITFVGSGEPLLQESIGWLIRRIKQMTRLPLAVITNGSLLHLPEVRRELAPADAVLPSLDAGTPALYRRINRPHPQLTFDLLIQGLTAFGREYQGKLWVEVMLVSGVNDTVQALGDLAAVLDKIRPHRVHLNLPTRPPAETWVRPPREAGLMRASSILGSIADVVHPAEGSFDLSGYRNIEQAVMEILTRHPMRQDELERTLAQWSPLRVNEALAVLSSCGKTKTVERHGALFWVSASCHHHDRIGPKE
jgi:wyosine [tRNA(Phe)-imidazoG37] synthetase (radical SAM superfamily)